MVRRIEFGLYDQLMVELRNKYPPAFHYFMRMPPSTFDELVKRLRSRLTKVIINFRPNLDPGLKVALTLWHMQYTWRHTTASTKTSEKW